MKKGSYSKAVAGAVGGAALGWMAWSRFGINHNRALPSAIDAQRTEFLSPRTGKLSYYEDRSAHGRPLVLLHSINAAASAYETRPMFELFRKHRPVFALDLPGFGFSGRSDRVYSPELYIHAILDWLNEAVASAEPVDVLALSLSGEFAALAAVQQPASFNSLALIGPTGFGKRFGHGSEAAYQAFRLPVWSQAFYDLLVFRPASITTSRKPSPVRSIWG